MAERKKTKLVLSIAIFELVHVVAHITHSNNLSVLQHYCTYVVMHYYAKPSRWTVLAQVVDTLVVALVGGLWQVFTGFVLFYSYTITDWHVVWGGTAVMLMMFNEHWNCDRMLAFYDAPYHVLLELVGMYVFHRMTRNEAAKKLV